MSIDFFIGPIVGAVIGYITNGIAIKMLFRPIKPIKIGKFILPFTPGIIPKEKDRLAKTVGQVVSRELLNEEVFKIALMKPEMIADIRTKVYSIIEILKEDKRTFKEAGEEILTESKLNFLVKSGEENVTFAIYSRVINMEIGKIIVEKIVKSFKEGTMSQFLGPMGFLIKDGFIEGIGQKIEPVISEMIANESESIIKKAVEDESLKLQFRTIGESAEKIEEYKEFIADSIIFMYKKFINEGLSNSLEKLDIQTMIQEKIMAFDTLEMEKLILEIMHKELKGVVWLGALLGAIMGLVMSIF